MAGAALAIPAKLEDTLLEMSGALNSATSRRWTHRELAAWLATDHGVAVDHTTVGRTLRRLRAEQAEVRREVIRERLHANLAPQIDTLDDLATKLAARAAGGKKPVSTGGLKDIVDQYRKVVETKLRFAGVGEKTDVDVTSNGQSLADFLSAGFDDDPAGPPPPVGE